MNIKEEKVKISTLPPFLTIFPARKLVQGSEVPIKSWKLRSLFLCYFLTIVAFIDYPAISNNHLIMMILCAILFTTSYTISSKIVDINSTKGNLFFSSGNYGDLLNDFLFIFIALTPVIYVEAVVLIINPKLAEDFLLFSNIKNSLLIHDGFDSKYWSLLGVVNYIILQHIIITVIGVCFVIFALLRNCRNIKYNKYDVFSNIVTMLTCLSITIISVKAMYELSLGERINTNSLTRNSARSYIMLIGQLTCFLSFASISVVLLFQSISIVVASIFSARDEVND